MDRYLTLSRSDLKFPAMLSGRFSATEVAIPTRSLEVSTSSERVTFQIRPRSELKLIAWTEILPRLFRWKLLGLTFGPLAVVAAYAHPNHLQSSWLWAGISLLLFHSGLFALNDYVDHLRGLDRVVDTAGSRVIQTGTLPAYFVFRIAAVLLAASFILAMPIFFQRPNLMLVGLAAFVLGVFGYSFARTGWRRLLVGGFSVFVTFGPLLVYGAFGLFDVMVTPDTLPAFLGISLAFGWMASIYSRSRQLGSAMVDHLAGIETFATRLGFDRAKGALFFDTLLWNAFFVFLWWAFFDINQIGFLALGVVYLSIRFSMSVLRSRSPIGSMTQSLPEKILRLQVMTIVVLVVGLLWQT